MQRRDCALRKSFGVLSFLCASVEFFIKDTIKRLRDRDDEGAEVLFSVTMAQNLRDGGAIFP